MVSFIHTSLIKNLVYLMRINDTTAQMDQRRAFLNELVYHLLKGILQVSSA